MKKLKYFVLFCALTLVIWISGCATSNAPNIVEIASGPDGAVTTQAIIHNKKLDRRLTIVSSDLLKVGNLLQAKCVIQNNTSATMPIVYRYQWFDNNDTPIDSALSNTWKNEWIDAGVPKTLTGMGANTQAARAQFLIKMAD